MTLGMQLLTTALTVTVTIIVTTLVNYFLSTPRRLKKQKEQEHQEVMKKIDDLETHVTEKLQQQDQVQESLKKDIDILKSGNQAIIKNELKLRYEKWLKLGYAPVDAKDDLEKMYCVYHQLGSNGVLTHIREQFLSLPDERVAKGEKLKKKEEE